VRFDHPLKIEGLGLTDEGGYLGDTWQAKNILLAAGGEDDDGDLAKGGVDASPVEKVPTAHDWHHQIEHDEARRAVPFEIVERFTPIFREYHAIILVRHHVAQAFAEAVFVIDDQNGVLVHRAIF
jgi:hypothetical protein